MDAPEFWLMGVCLTLVVIAIVAHLIPTRKHEEDTTAYWRRKIERNGRRQQWGGK